MATPFNSYREFLQERYGGPVHRVPIDFGFGCPHRNPDGTGGCTFCSPDGGRARQTAGVESVRAQIEAGIRFARRRYRARNFMAYIQAHTGTFAPDSAQRQCYEEILDCFPFDIIVVGTRPDCIDEDTLQVLTRLNRDREIRVELGVQTIHDCTLRRIRRGHDWACSREAIKRLTGAGLPVSAHLMVGLPGETSEQMLETARVIGNQQLSGVKLHNLHIVKGTRLAAEYARKPFPVLDEHEYAELLLDMLRRLPPELPIMRLVTDSPDEQLVAPRWQMSKGQFTEYLTRLMLARHVQQGDLTHRCIMVDLPRRDAIQTHDKSITFWNPDVKEHYHTPAGARSEAERKYVAPADLTTRLEKGSVRLLDVCFGLGYNALSASETAARHQRSAAGRLHITALEIDRRVVLQAAESVRPQASPFSWNDTLAELGHHGQAQAPNTTIDLLWGDARHTVRELDGGPAFDVVFLDAFSPPRNSELWTLDFFGRLYSLLSPDGILLTYCAAIPVRSGLAKAGFCVGETVPFGRARGGTAAARCPAMIHRPLPAKEQQLIHASTRGIPYRDPHGTWTHKEILRFREERIRNYKKVGKRRA